MLLTLVLATVTTFPGGTANELVENLAVATHRDVVVAQATVSPIRKVEYEASDLTLLARAFSSKAGLRMKAGQDLILHDGLVSPDKIGDIEPPPGPRWVGLEKADISDGTVTFVTKDKDRLDLQKLPLAKFSKPLKVHWFYEKVPVSIHATKMPEATFLTYLAKAVGGRFVNLPKEYRIDFDPDEMRARISKRLETWPKEWLPETVANDPTKQIAALQSLIDEIPKASMAAAFETRISMGTFDIRPNGKFAKAVIEFMETNGSYEDENGPAFLSESGPIYFRSIFRNDYTVQARLSANFMFIIRLLRRDDPDFKVEFRYSRLGRY